MSEFNQVETLSTSYCSRWTRSPITTAHWLIKLATLISYLRKPTPTECKFQVKNPQELQNYYLYTLQVNV